MDDIEINSNQFWFKIVGFLQQNWALIESQPMEEKSNSLFYTRCFNDF